MKCPKCQTEIPDAEVAKHFAAKGGRSKSDAKAASNKLNAQKPRPRAKGGRKPGSKNKPKVKDKL